jgi:glycosyltransferase involved in cell wall biosynthesis
MEQTKLSVVIITFNEERNIERCIRSVEGIADDIVILDSFSKDSTCEIATSLGARVVQHVFDGHIEQKNRAINHAKYPFILSLDADEALSNELRHSIRDIKNNKRADGYSMNRITNYCGKWIHHCGWYPDTKLRLWDSTKGAWGGINPHDKYEMEAGSVTQILKGDILHYSYYTRDDHHKQVRKFTDIASAALFAKEKKITVAGMLIRTVAKFLGMYVFRLGFLDGSAGFTICRISAYATYLKYAKLRHLHKKA